LVIDDGSTDSTRSVVAERYGGNPRVRYVHQPNRGVAAARNLGLRLAGGEYIAFLDSDDLWKPWKIELQVACLRALPGVGMIWTDMDAVDDQGKIVASACMRSNYSAYGYFPGDSMFEQSKPLAQLAPIVKDPGRDTRVYWGDVFPHMVMGNLCQPSTVLVTRERALKAGGFNESMRSGEDHDFHLRLCREGPAALLDVASTLYRAGAADQLTRPEYQLMIAQNALRTILPVIERDRSRIKLPASMIRRKLASAHNWVAVELLGVDNRAARHHFRMSLRQWPWQKKAWMRLAGACASPRITRLLRAIYGKLVGKLSPRHGARKLRRHQAL
jgi:glycosyl transferase family 2